MRYVDSQLVDKMDEAVTHYINSHQPSESVHVDANGLSLNVQDDGGGRVVTVMHSQTLPSSQMCRQVSVGEQVGDGPWGEELLDTDGRLAALVAHLAQHSKVSHYQTSHHKVPSVRDMDASVILDAPIRLFNGQTLDQQGDSIVVDVPQLPPLPPLQEMKRCPETDWFNNKTKNMLKDDNTMLTDSDGPVLEMAGASPAQHKQQNKKSLPHKKRISRKLKRNNGSSTPQQDIVLINCSEEVQQEEILPDNFVSAVQHQEHLPEDTHHITHEMRPIFICQLCGEFYGEDQLKFFQHLKQHYEPHTTIIIENPVPDMGIDKMTNTCIVDNVATLPDSIVELSLEDTVPKTMYQPMDKHILYTSSDKTLNYSSNKLQYSMASMDKEPPVHPSEADKSDLYETLDKLEMYRLKSHKSYKKQKPNDAHIKETNTSAKLDDMGEFSEPEDLMEGIHVAVEEGGDHYEHILPHLTVDNGHVHQDHVRHWYMRGANESQGAESPPSGATSPRAAPAYSATPAPAAPAAPAAPPAGRDTHYSPDAQPHHHHDHHDHHEPHEHHHFKDEILKRILEAESPALNTNYANHMLPNYEVQNPPEHRSEDVKPTEQAKTVDKKTKTFSCVECGRVFHHKNSLMYHMLSHSDKQQACRECGKTFYTPGALKVHKRVHNDDRPYKCEDCGRSFRQWSVLKYHKMSIHSTQKLFKCEFCEKEFARKYSLNLHRRIHTGERNYKCDYCNKTFRASHYRLSHMRTHTGDKPYKCSQCGKCFRVTGDLRRHFVIHEKMRNRIEEHKNKKEAKDAKDKKATANKVDVKVEPPNTSEGDNKQVPKTVKKVAVASTTRGPILRNVDKKTRTKKNQGKKDGAPNVTIGHRLENGQYKMDGEYSNMGVFDVRHADEEYHKFKEVYNENEALTNYKAKEQYSGQVVNYKDAVGMSETRDFAVLRPMFKNDHESVSDKQVYARSENTDGKMQVFTHVEKSKDYNGPIVSNSVSLGDMRHLDRETARDTRNDSLHGETIENGFLERLAGLYNIPAI
ncbi:uncharacterized protein LOC113523365 isoform X2 [Galleria mellonella]|uniref:Uncharacterized protein LOC113523365 isoform X2 n=1 Tax=Galleria mellonella TaxID=7137 RepID=A0A6J1X9N5_GALME|nr:uncharacterized protein LOC113523365 isoform X2 [Galleria mellonella]